MSEENIKPLIVRSVREYSRTFRGPDGVCYANISVDGHLETAELRSDKYRSFISKHVYEDHNEIIGKSSFNAVMDLTAGQLQDKPPADVHIRTAGENGVFWVDNVGRKGRTARIHRAGWTLLDSSEIFFRRPGGMRPLPEPAPSGDLNRLREFVNVSSDADYRLLVAWILGSLLPSGWLDYPILWLRGPEGSGKSAMATICLELVDPHTAGVRSLPHSLRSFNQAAGKFHVQAFDNLSPFRTGTAGWEADAFCRLATGASSVERTLRTDRDITVIQMKSPVVLTSIPFLSERPDFLSRAMVIRLPLLEKSNDRHLAAFREATPEIMAGLFDGLSTALSYFESTTVKEPGRMPDWARLITAAETGKQLGWRKGTIVKDFNANQEELRLDVRENYPVYPKILRLLENEDWIDHTPTETYETLKDLAGDASKRPGWPKGPKQLSEQVDRLERLFQHDGIVVERHCLRRGVSRKKHRRLDFRKIDTKEA